MNLRRFFLCVAFVSQCGLWAADKDLPDHLIPRQSTQVKDGFGINSDLPRDPFIPWNRWWWTRMFDAGVNFIRIGQYENSSDYTSWEWVERKRGEYSVVPELDDYVNSLVENGLHIEIQLLYGNPLYTSPAGRLPQTVTPEPGSFHNPDRSLYSVFWPPKTDEQIAAFTKYVEWMVNHFRGRVEYYEIWNEPNIDYWNPASNPEDYGRLFKASAKAIHDADPNAKAVFGGLAGANQDFAKRALDACDCAAAVDIFAYHNYPDYGHNLNPEGFGKDNDTNESSKPLREMVRSYPGIRKELMFWNDEFNDGLASWTDSDESVQAKYIPRGLLIDRATGVRTFVWLIVGATDGNELDDFGMLHGLKFQPNDFMPRPVFAALQNTNTLFSDTQLDSSIKIEADSTANLRTYAFRNSNGKAILAYWLPILSKPGDQLPTQTTSLKIRNSGIRKPVLVDITSGKITRLSWRNGGDDTLEQLPLRDSVMAITDESYFDWPELPETPSELNASHKGTAVQLTWKVHGGHPEFVMVERRAGQQGKWEQVSKLPVNTASFSDSESSKSSKPVSYRVRAGNSAGSSAYSNVATLRE
ncbi:MAG: GH39 family glycosyl hydrolase [Bryobacteraceae bacterium]